MVAQNHHIVLFPFMAQGHISPFLLLANQIQKTNPSYTITLINTPLNIQKLKISLPPNSKINLKSLPFNSSLHGLPPDTETTAFLPFNLIINILQASQTLYSSFHTLIADITQQDGFPPSCIIADHFLGWTVDIARKFGIFHSIFLTCGAYGGAVYFSLWKNLPHTKTNLDEFPLPEFPEICVRRSQLPNHLITANGEDPWSVFVQHQISFYSNSDAMIVNTAEEFEVLGLQMLSKLFKIPVWAVGPLLCLPPTTPCSIEHDLLKWLDSQRTASVLYISFGSQNTISSPQMMYLAMGLEFSGIPFIWVIRPPLGSDMRGKFRPEWLPGEFEDRMLEKKQGALVHGWAPQVEILLHSSVGGFLSHCGWNSVLESLICGVPIIGWPLTGDQIYNSKFLEEVGVCVEVGRGGKERVEKVIGMVMGEGIKAMDMRMRASEIGKKLRAANSEVQNEVGGKGFVGSSVRGLAKFLHEAVSKVLHSDTSDN